MRRLMMIGALALMPGLAAADDPGLAGNWLRANRTVRIAVTPCGGNYCVENIWVKRPNGPEKAGDKMVLSLHPVAAGEFKGTAWDLKRHLTYRMTVTVDGDQLETDGCVLFGVICKSTFWTRIN